MTVTKDPHCASLPTICPTSHNKCFYPFAYLLPRLSYISLAALAERFIWLSVEETFPPGVSCLLISPSSHSKASCQYIISRWATCLYVQEKNIHRAPDASCVQTQSSLIQHPGAPASPRRRLPLVCSVIRRNKKRVNVAPVLAKLGGLFADVPSSFLRKKCMCDIWFCSGATEGPCWSSLTGVTVSRSVSATFTHTSRNKSSGLEVVSAEQAVRVQLVVG